MTVLVIYQLFWQQLFLDNNWVRDPWRGYDHLSDSLLFSIIVEILLGILLSVWIGMNTDVSVYLASMYLDASVLGLKSIPVLGPRSRPFSLTIVMFISMGVRTIALVVPGMLKHRFLVICHAHPGGRHAHEVEVEVPPSREQGELNAAYDREPPALEGVTVHRPDPTYGSLGARAPSSST